MFKIMCFTQRKLSCNNCRNQETCLRFGNLICGQRPHLKLQQHTLYRRRADQESSISLEERVGTSAATTAYHMRLCLQDLMKSSEDRGFSSAAATAHHMRRPVQDLITSAEDKDCSSAASAAHHWRRAVQDSGNSPEDRLLISCGNSIPQEESCPRFRPFT